MFSASPSRRSLLQAMACGFGYTALSALAAESSAENPLALRPPHHAARAKRIIFLFMQGGPSPMESFDYKPQLNADHGKPAPFERDGKFEQPGVATMKLFGSSWKFDRHGESGTWVSQLFPHIGDGLCAR